MKVFTSISAKNKKKKKRRKKKNRDFLIKYWSLLEPYPYPELMVSREELNEFYKQSSSLNKVQFTGKLRKEDDGYVYLDIKNDIVDGLFSLLDKEEGAKKPPYFGKGNIGAHISVISSEEGEELEDTEIKEIGMDINFALKDAYSTKPDGWEEMERVWFVNVAAPELTKIRKRYGLPATYDGKNHSFHITFGVKETK